MEQEVIIDETLDEHLFNVSNLFKVLSDHSRVKILTLLSNKPYCVSELASTLAMSQSSVSHHLKDLRMANLVKTTKSGQNIFYTLTDNHVRIILQVAIDHSKEI
jgi:DNA-binding transcriptional ArsR family regulator